MTAQVKAPFPYFGGKSKVAGIVWERFGDVRNYVEPFFGSGAVLFGRPQPFAGPETINDKDGFVANIWRAMKDDPGNVAFHADWPVNENDLHARNARIIEQKADLVARLEGDPDYYDPKIAGWWIWGCCAGIGNNWGTGKGPWHVEDGRLVKHSSRSDPDPGIKRGLPHLNGGRGINRTIPPTMELSMGITRGRPDLGSSGRGINREIPLIRNGGRGEFIREWFDAISERLRDVRVCCGDWSRVCGNAPTTNQGLTGIFLDPPYADTAKRCSDIYATDDLNVAHEVRRWAIEHGDDPKMRIALCGYEGEHEIPDSWECFAWKTNGGMASKTGRGQINAAKERIWFSPHCLKPGAGTTQAPALSTYLEEAEA